MDLFDAPDVELRRPKLSDAILIAYAREIVSGRLKAGAPLPSEPDSAARYGVSKVVVRDSIKALVAVGLVRVQQGKRTIVADEIEWDVLSSVVQEAYLAEGLTADLVHQFYEARQIIEPAAAALAAARATASQIAELSVLADTMHEIASGSGDIEVFLQVDREFHNVIASSVGNVALRALVRSLHAQTAASWTSSRITPSDLAELARQHSTIADAIAERQGHKASSAMERHIAAADELESARLAVAPHQGDRPIR